MLTSEILEVTRLRRAALPTGRDRLLLASGDLANLAEESRSPKTLKPGLAGWVGRVGRVGRVK